MKTLIVSIDAKYVHTMLAPWYLRAESQKTNSSIIKIIEFTVNTQFEKILRSIGSFHPDVLAFSCYIFNFETVAGLVREVKKILPGVKIVLGGPEVSYDPEEQLAALPPVDFVVSGEGERPFAALLGALEAGKLPQGIPGVALRGPDGPLWATPSPPPALEDLASPYTPELLEAARGKIIYYESSRGCPFRCGYCLSSLSGGVRFLPLPRVKEELCLLLGSDVRQIKFVDRTFNCSPARAAEIVRFLAGRALDDKTGRIAAKNIHFEMAADLFSEELFDALRSAPPGFFQLEIGIQSFHAATLEAVSRKTDLALSARNIRRLVSFGNMHIHLDLIAGLPLEDAAEFALSFDAVYALGPHVIQLGFLKLLKGSEMRRMAGRGGYAYLSRPPYEVLATPWISYGELCFFKDVAETVERVYNSGKFVLSCAFAVSRFETPFAFFAAFARYLGQNGCFDRSLSLRELYGSLLFFGREAFCGRDAFALGELLKFDCLASDPSGVLPPSLPHIPNPALRELARAAREKLPRGARFHLETFAFDPQEKGACSGPERAPVVYCFDGSAADRVTGRYRAWKLEN